MLNPDGVIYGNSRCDLLGTDPNRQWLQPSKMLHPNILAVKQDIASMGSQMAMCLDLHGHSKAYGVFGYCCRGDNGVDCRVLPMMISQLNDDFIFPACTFGISKGKEKTGRAVVHHMKKCLNVLTIQCSTMGTRQKMFEPIDMQMMAYSIINAVSDYVRNGQKRRKVQVQIRKQLRQLIRMTYQDQGQSGSDSDPEGDQIQLKDKIGTIIPKTIDATDILEQPPKKKKKHKKAQQGNKEIIKKTVDQDNIRAGQNWSAEQSQTQQSKQLLQAVPSLSMVPPHPLVMVANKKNTAETQKKSTAQRANSNPNGLRKSEAAMPIIPRTAQRYDTNLTLPKPNVSPRPPSLSTEQPLQILAPSYRKNNAQPTLGVIRSYNSIEMNPPQTVPVRPQYTISLQQTQQSNDLGFLCVLSEKNKQFHLERLKQQQQEKKSPQKRFSITRGKTNHSSNVNNQSNNQTTQLGIKQYSGQQRSMYQIEQIPEVKSKQNSLNEPKKSNETVFLVGDQNQHKSELSLINNPNTPSNPTNPTTPTTPTSNSHKNSNEHINRSGIISQSAVTADSRTKLLFSMPPKSKEKTRNIPIVLQSPKQQRISSQAIKTSLLLLKDSKEDSNTSRGHYESTTSRPSPINNNGGNVVRNYVNKREAIRSLRERQLQHDQVISKIWRQNFEKWMPDVNKKGRGVFLGSTSGDR